MSKGPGKWQRAILAALEQQPAVYLMDLLPVERSRVEVVALNRAARNLTDSGKIETFYDNDRNRVIVKRLGFQIVEAPIPGAAPHFRCVTNVPRLRRLPVSP